MLSKKLFLLMHKVALFAIVFASLAPTVSHAMATPAQAKSFFQEVCSVNGQKLLLKVVTTQGNQLQTALNVKPVQQPATISHHLNHCPFCHAGVADILLPATNVAFVIYLQQQQALLKDAYQAPYFQQVSYQSPLTRGPPQHSND